MARSKGPGRPEMPDGKSITISVKIGKLTAGAIDKARGKRTRSAWLQSVIAAALVDPGASPIRQRVQALPGGREALAEAEVRRSRERQAPRENDCPHPKASVIKGRCTRCQTFVGF